ncbi:hypothetical protein Purlil1_1290 [Purpureocillium lilacinum]|uniref:Uncharacterized protein n=1 Tax=Purpureocillium lilacinum TaxID=33203 RepID=A0ABR0CEY3_PURLI|nr:hypothetical protein Purlil1_1290 [Purpureocillium lilacinum]
MKPLEFLTTAAILISQGYALTPPLDKYDVFTPQWEIELAPGGPLVVLNGTVQEVHAELLKLNPSWDTDFAGVYASGSTDDRANLHEMEKRTDFRDSAYNCFGRWGRASAHSIWEGITHLRKVPGRPGNGAGPGNCGRVSCSYSSAIWWCNDSRSPKTLNSFGSIADGADEDGTVMPSPPNPQTRFPTLKGKVAIVTGASRGIGRSIALELAKQGVKVVATYVSPSSKDAMQDLVEQVKRMKGSSDCYGVRADLSDSSSAKTIVDETVAAFGPHIDIVVNNAGIEVVKPLSEIEVSDFNNVYNVNVLAPILLMRQVKPRLRRPGRIINIGSVGARSGFKDLSLYCSSKAALEGLTRCWAAELGSDGHSVNVVNPGPVQSDMLDNIPQDIISMQKATTPLQNRLGTFNDVAQIVAWLASEESRWVTGQAISASGGWAMY